MNRFPLRLRQSNPFYLLSAASMLGGCLALTNSWTNIPTPRDFVLLGTLNVYEAALIALAWYLIRHRHVSHDGSMLLALEAFFLVDVTFLNAQIVTSNFALGLMLNSLLFLVAIVKLLLITKLAGLSPRDGRFGAIVLQLTTLFAVPFIFRHFDDGDLPTRFFYGAWWLAGMMIPACFMLSSLRKEATAQPSFNGLVRLLCVLPWLSFALHLSILHYVYRVDFYAAETAPVMLGLACLLYHVKPTTLAPRRDLRILQAGLPAIALLVSLGDPPSLCFAIDRHARIYVTPSDLSVAGAYMTYIYCCARPYAFRLLTGGAAVLLALVFGPSAQQMAEAGSKTWSWVGGAVWAVVPKTAMRAGITAIAAAFAFLGLGAIVSIRRRAPAISSQQLNDPQP